MVDLIRVALNRRASVTFAALSGAVSTAARESIAPVQRLTKALRTRRCLQNSHAQRKARVCGRVQIKPGQQTRKFR